MGGAQCGAQFPTNPLKDGSMLPCTTRQLSSLSFLLFASLSFCSLYSFSTFSGSSSQCPLSGPFCSLFTALKSVSLMAAHFLFCPHQIACCCSLGVPCLGVIITGSQGVATCPPTNYASSSSLVQFFGYVEKWLVHHLSSRNRPQILIHRSSIPYQIRFLHRACSHPLDLEPPDPTPFTHLLDH